MSLLARFQPVCATLGGMRAVGAAVQIMAARHKSSVYVRYVTPNDELGNMKSLLHEFINANADKLNEQYVGIVFRKSKQDKVIGTKGYAFLNATTPDKAMHVQVYLSPSPKDPYVLAVRATQEKVLEKLGTYGTVGRVDIAANRNSQWPYGFMWVEFEEDGAAEKALDLNMKLVEGCNTALVVKISVDSKGNPRTPNANPSARNAPPQGQQRERGPHGGRVDDSKRNTQQAEDRQAPNKEQVVAENAQPKLPEQAPAQKETQSPSKEN